MRFKRRSLLKTTGLTLAAWALEGKGLDHKILGRLQQSSATLAAPARKKFALLVGINQYSHHESCPELMGCINDLALQRQLLIHRFGFEPDNIVTLQNKQATRSGFQTAFIEHLLAQVTAEDTVFFHFSGYGSTVQATADAEMQRSLVLYDSCATSKSIAITDWPEATLLLLLRALPTERIVSVLDTGYRLPEESPASDGVRLRSRPSPAPAPFDEQTLTLQNALQKQLKSRGFLPSASQSAGVVLQATDLMKAALEVEAQAGGVGLMTYALSQQLWHANAAASWREVLAGTMTRLSRELSMVQTPQLLEVSAPGRALEKSGLHALEASGGAGAVVSARNSNDIDLWLGGLSSQALVYCEAGSILQVVGEDASEVRSPASSAPESDAATLSSPAPSQARYLQIDQRSDLNAQAKLFRQGNGEPALPQVGALVREQVRVIPRQIDLAIAIDKRLDRIERVDATSALSAIPRVTVVAMKHDPADYVFGRVLQQSETLLASVPPEMRPAASTTADGAVDSVSDSIDDGEKLDLPGSEYGLLTLGREILPATLGASSEAIKTAVQRLQPHLETLRAAKNFQLLENSLTTQLAAQSRWDVLAASSTVRGSASVAQAVSPKSRFRLLSLASSDRLRYQLKNESDRPVYAVVMGFDPQGRWKPLVTTNLVAPLAPAIQAQGEIRLGKRPGLTELYTLFSTSPFELTQALLTGGVTRMTAAQADQPVADPYALSEALLQDLAHASQQLETALPSPNEVYGLNLQAWAGFRQTCRVT